MKKITIIFLLLIPMLSIAQAVKSYKKQNDKVVITLDKGELHLIPLTDNTIRVQYGLDMKNQLPELVFVSKVKMPDFKVSDSNSFLEISIAKMTVVVDKISGTISYRNSEGKVFLSEKPGGRIFKQSSVQGEPTSIVEQGFTSLPDEYLFGTGQFQDGYLNIKGLPRRLTQVNTQISIPFLMSSKGYGLLWHNYGLTDFNPADNVVNFDAAGASGEAVTVNVTTTNGTQKETRQNGTFNGSFIIKEAGEYAILLDVGQKMARKWQLTIDGKDVLNFKNHWLPPTTSILVNLTAGKHNMVVTGEKNDLPVVYYRKVTNETVFRSPVANVLDYVVFAGNPDEVISSYRNLTGKAPLMPNWALGYIHCRERFTTQDELLANAKEFRKRKLPMDMIVQDWQYWGKYGWNSMKFDEKMYPNPSQMVKELHQMNMRLMLSVWSKIDKESQIGIEFDKKKYYIPDTQWIDFFNPDAANYYWTNFSKKLLKPYEIDAWWLDATEPENDDLVGRKINSGTMSGEQMRNVYPMFVTKTVYEGSRKDAPDKRVFILTRSAFSGQQRYATAVWTGDVGNDWETLRRQITAGLNLSITGLPWWTFDAGGFFRPDESQYTDPKFHERFLRWFQLATFSPLQRVHGYTTNTEFWRFGEKVETEALKYLNLRYRLMPYIYSQAADITFKNGTFMRPLVMDFANDTKALEQNYEYMFGSAFLVAPVVSEGMKNWDVYLPENQSGWFNFWTGKQYNGGQTVQTDASLTTIPLYVKSGSIIPMGEKMQYTNEKPADTLDIRVYAGANGKFELYEDEGVNYNYEKGAFSIIPFEWNEQKQTLIIGKRKGQSFNGLIKNRVFNIVWVDESNGIGLENQRTNILVKYNGNSIEVQKK
ncbi:glycoside hydrolase family 31 protein [Flavobacterium salmonis]|uniref:Glycosyl hydrolase family 31 n=1 Tax=Flavobacterium salmonis TaxID=2654844 RepID=A0A6V6YSD2_9FLAO|nr:glycoside hydrolase family 31 protein [Flavobacterium salmonis]CAD0002395.1 glycosyl hydrolase family 31 [Flavobacterium salmonis]